MSRDCPEPEKPRNSNCHNCGEEGHISRECTKPRKPKEGQLCFNCNQPDHYTADCPQPADPNRKPAVTFVPEDIEENELFPRRIDQGSMFDRFFDCDVDCNIKDARIETFADFPLTEEVRMNVQKSGYSKPTPVQQSAMPLIMQGKDLMACAQTGTGKTAAFLLPIMTKLLTTGDLANSAENPCMPRCVIVAPTRELVQQIYNEARKFASDTILRVESCIGEVSVSYSLNRLKMGASIVVGTMGRLLHFVRDGHISLQKCKFVVLDEADRMLDQGFYENICELVSPELGMPSKDQRQTLMFSATFPGTIRELGKQLLRTGDDCAVLSVDKIGAANKCIVQDFILVEDRHAKKDRLLELLNIDLKKYQLTDTSIFEKKTLVFVNKKMFADRLATTLCEAQLPCTTIHGDRTQQQRNEALNEFRSGRKPVLVATAVAERGLDIKGVDHVINFDLPQDIEDYVHRIGRTGRVGNPGRATSLFVPNDDGGLAEALCHSLGQAEQVVPEFLQGGSGSYQFGSAPAVPAPADDEDWC